MKPVSTATRRPMLLYRKPSLGRGYWLLDDALPDPDEVRARLLARTDRYEGYRHKPESWPGMRAMPALDPAELAPLEEWVRKQTGGRRLWVETAADGATLNHHCVQVVGYNECESRPHTDCRAVPVRRRALPESPSTRRLRHELLSPARAGRATGRQTVQPPHSNLVQALGTRFVPLESFVEDVTVPHRYNRLLVYRANMIHSASGCWGQTLETKPMAAVFFRMA